MPECLVSNSLVKGGHITDTAVSHSHPRQPHYNAITRHRSRLGLCVVGEGKWVGRSAWELIPYEHHPPVMGRDLGSECHCFLTWKILKRTACCLPQVHSQALQARDGPGGSTAWLHLSFSLLSNLLLAFLQSGRTQWDSISSNFYSFESDTLQFEFAFLFWVKPSMFSHIWIFSLRCLGCIYFASWSLQFL